MFTCKYGCRAGIAVLFWAIGSSFLSVAQAQESGNWEEVDSVTIEQSPVYSQRRVGYYTFHDFILADNSAVSDTLRFVITESSHTVQNASGVTDNGYPFFDIASITDTLQVFFEHKRGRLSYSGHLEQFVQGASSQNIEVTYDFEGALASQNGGWGFVLANYGTIDIEQSNGYNGTAAVSYTDINAGINTDNQSLLWHVWGDNNPWSQALAGTENKQIARVTVRVKVEKGAGNIGTSNITVVHNLLPWNVGGTNKFTKVNASKAVGPNYSAVVSASQFGDWVDLTFFNTLNNTQSFVIPSTWVKEDGSDIDDVLPSFFFGGLEVGDKVYIDDYYMLITEHQGRQGDDDDNASNAPVRDENPTFSHDFNENRVADNQGAQGWIYPTTNRGIVNFDSAGGLESSGALTYEDTSPNVQILQNGVRYQAWANNPWTASFGAGNHGKTLTKVSLWVKVEKVIPGTVTVKHHLLPWPLNNGNKSEKNGAAIDASPEYVATISADNNEQWIQVEFVNAKSGLPYFTIPDNWVHFDGASLLSVYPEFLFGGLDEGDKVTIDGYHVESTFEQVVDAPLEPDEGRFLVDVNFNGNTIAGAQNQSGWWYPTNNRGVVTHDADGGQDGSGAFVFEDTSTNTQILQTGIRMQDRTSRNPWNDVFSSAIGNTIEAVSVRVKVEKAIPGDVELQHYLLPWELLDGNKATKVNAARASGPAYTAVIPAVSNGQWVDLSLIDSKSGESTFTIPESWVHYDDTKTLSLYPEFLFGGLEVGDKVTIDHYYLEGALLPPEDEPETDYGVHDGSGTYTTTARPEPMVVEDTQFYSAPISIAVIKNLVTDYLVDNTDTEEDTAGFQQALDDMSNNLGGGKLVVPAGDYYVRSVHLRSNVHLEIDPGATFYIAPGGGYNVWMFEMGNGNQGKAENFSMVGLGNGFTIDLRNAPNERTAVFKMGDIENFKFSNFTIEDGKTIFASFLVGITERDNEIFWPVNGIIEKIDQRNALFGYGLVQTYAADNILFRDLHSEGGITLRMETDNLTMKDKGKGGIRDIYGEDIRCTDGLAAVMFGPHFQENGSVQVDGVTSNGCGFAVRVDDGFVELFSPQGEVYTREGWKAAVDAELGDGCSAQPYARGVNQYAARINPIKSCLDGVHRKYGLKPGWFAESYIYNVTVNYGVDAHLKQNQLDYFSLSNPTCANVCLPSVDQWSRQGQIYIGPSLGGSIDYNEMGQDYNFNINIINLQMQGFPDPSHIHIDRNSSSSQVCGYYSLPVCPDSRWD